jgi:hypothetical protein
MSARFDDNGCELEQEDPRREATDPPLVPTGSPPLRTQPVQREQIDKAIVAERLHRRQHETGREAKERHADAERAEEAQADAAARAAEDLRRLHRERQTTGSSEQPTERAPQGETDGVPTPAHPDARQTPQEQR